MGTFLEKLEQFFSEEENFLAGAKPVNFKGARYMPYAAREDEGSVWPNVHCAGCGRLELKKRMYFSPGSGRFFHPACMSGEGGRKA